MSLTKGTAKGKINGDKTENTDRAMVQVRLCSYFSFSRSPCNILPPTRRKLTRRQTLKRRFSPIRLSTTVSKA